MDRKLLMVWIFTFLGLILGSYGSEPGTPLIISHSFDFGATWGQELRFELAKDGAIDSRKLELSDVEKEALNALRTVDGLIFFRAKLPDSKDWVFNSVELCSLIEEGLQENLMVHYAKQTVPVSIAHDKTSECGSSSANVKGVQSFIVTVKRHNGAVVGSPDHAVKTESDKPQLNDPNAKQEAPAEEQSFLRKYGIYIFIALVFTAITGRKDPAPVGSGAAPNAGSQAQGANKPQSSRGGSSGKSGKRKSAARKNE
ncbi:hypothetical protein NDN08_005081 [Rhodosorus marinus]|uniref:ER membrane protein complex subunit 10 n=1 Tax=Rhodosorus marinus TaxID=101924 RepID=A0AAV8V3P1_9RHOD|nr:hypothetical protein NDN08_005081 [Rhodosorus marinus]